MSASAVATPAGRVRRRGSSQTGASAVSKASAQGRTRRVWRRAAGGGAAALALLAGADALYRWSLASPYFQMREVKVSGTAHLSQSVVRARLGLRRTDNFLAADLEILRRRIESHPWVRSASLSRDLPGTLRVEVVERKPWAVLFPTGDRGRGTRLIDAEGVILAEGGAEAGGEGWKGLPVLRGLDVRGTPKSLRAGRPLSGKAIETGL
ncbi:MAG TPA: FtsQ-type POTRA domain-containing protein, partial [Nitrospinota bacterium]|nr:FtsQ-type POTRA domain-containing protein [Nitrospinota bacterium]